MARYIVLLAIALSTGCASTDWTRRDMALEIAFQITNAADAVTTSRIQYRSDLKEIGPAQIFLGEQPSTRDTAVYFATAGVSHYLISRALPPKWRPWFQGGTIASSAYYVHNNCVKELC